MAEQIVAKNSFVDRLRSWLGTSARAPDQTKAPMDVSTRLAYDRTFLAHERTLMAWVRTSSSLITFGFSIYKFFQLERGTGKEFPSAQVIGPRQFSMILIIIEIVSLVMATIENRRQMRLLKMEYDTIPSSSAGWVAGLDPPSGSRLSSRSSFGCKRCGESDEGRVSRENQFSFTGANRVNGECFLINSVFSVASCKEVTSVRDVGRVSRDEGRVSGVEGRGTSVGCRGAGCAGHPGDDRGGVP
jgi:putative membrane protein